ncbi:hypothetical protein ACFLSH_00900 [Bacteroidota bacterium]
MLLIINSQTVYPPNLRLSVQEMTEEEWVMLLHEREDLPPMPWMNVNNISEEVANAIYKIAWSKR